MIFWIEIEKVILLFRGIRKLINNFFFFGINFFFDIKEIFKIFNKFGKGWFKEYMSGVFDIEKKYY